MRQELHDQGVVGCERAHHEALLACPYAQHLRAREERNARGPQSADDHGPLGCCDFDVERIDDAGVVDGLALRIDQGGAERRSCVAESHERGTENGRALIAIADRAAALLHGVGCTSIIEPTAERSTVTGSSDFACASAAFEDASARPLMISSASCVRRSSSETRCSGVHATARMTWYPNSVRITGLVRPSAGIAKAASTYSDTTEPRGPACGASASNWTPSRRKGGR